MSRLMRNPAIVAREVDDAVFLVGPANDSVFHLNAVGAAIWRLLAEPVSATDAAEILISAFPGVPAAQVRSDVESLFDDLDAGGFLIRAD